MMKATGARGANHYAEHADWGEMQNRPNAPIDFQRHDMPGLRRAVRYYEE